MAKINILFMGLALIASSYAKFNFNVNHSEASLQALRVNVAEQSYTVYPNINKVPFDDKEGFLVLLTQKNENGEIKNDIYNYKVAEEIAEELNESLTPKDDKIEPFNPMNMEETELKNHHLRYYVATSHQNSVNAENLTPPCTINFNGVNEVVEVPATAEDYNDEDVTMVVSDGFFGLSAGKDASPWELTKAKAIANLFAAHHLKNAADFDANTLSVGHTDKIKEILGEAKGKPTDDDITDEKITEETSIYKLPLNGDAAEILENKSDAHGIVSSAGGAVFVVRNRTGYVYTSDGLSNEQLVAAKDKALTIEHVNEPTFVVHMEEYSKESIEFLCTPVASAIFKHDIPAEIKAATKAAAAAEKGAAE